MPHTAHPQVYFYLKNPSAFVQVELAIVVHQKENSQQQQQQSEFIAELGLLGLGEHLDCYFLSGID